MNESGSLGLFLSREKALAVWTSAGSDEVTRTQCITPSQDEPVTLALQAARTVVRQSPSIDEAFVAIDCGYYTQYKLHSEFDDYNQVESTIKYDAEEAAAADALNLAVAFDITGKAQPGSEVTVYTADRQLMTDILLDVQEGSLDPTFIEPDVVCLSRALSHTANMSERTDTLFIVLTDTSCYMIHPQADFAPAARTFLIGKGQDVTQLLSREIMLARGSSDPSEPITSVALLGDWESLDRNLLAQRTGLDIQVQELEESLAQILHDNKEIACHELLIAYGAALAARTRGHKTDFRRDFMPYQGRRKMLEGSLRLIGISMTVLLVAVAVFFQLKAFRMNKDTSRLNDKLLLEHRKATFDKVPPRGMPVSSSLRREFQRAEQMEAGIGPGDDKSVPAKLTFFFEAINNTSPKVEFEVQQISVTERSMKVKGSTNNRSATMALLNEIKKHQRINLGSERVAAGPGGRDIFDITLEPKKSEKRR